MTNITEKPIYVSREEKNGVTQELVKQLFDYRDGFLYWKVSRSNVVKVGDRSSFIMQASKNSKIYYGTSINSVLYRCARIIFFYHHGYFPKFVDHINRNTLDDRIENLRAATYEENMRNVTPKKNKPSQYLGVFLAEGKYWVAQIHVNRKTIGLGYFKTQELAALAYNRAAVKYWGEFANLNIIQPK
jgi:hypothetical protein